MSKKGKIVKLVLSLALVGSLLLTGCSTNGDNGGDEAEASLQGKRKGKTPRHREDPHALKRKPA